MPGFDCGEAAVAVVTVAVGDVAGEREREGVPVEVVGVAHDELADDREVTLDWVQIAGVGWGRDELDPVGGGVGPDIGGPVGREVVLVGATVDASGQSRGGSVRIGRGHSNAQTVTVTPATTIQANALESGSGGQVMVGSDHKTTFDGAVSARGVGTVRCRNRSCRCTTAGA